MSDCPELDRSRLIRPMPSLKHEWHGGLVGSGSRLVTGETSLVRAGIRSRQHSAGLLGVGDSAAEWRRWREEEREGEQGGTEVRARAAGRAGG